MNTGAPLFTEDLTEAKVARQSVLHDAAHLSCLTVDVVRP
jgi:hypothetical protein